MDVNALRIVNARYAFQMPNDDDMASTPASRLKRARRAARFKTASEAARQFGIPYPTYAGWENGSRSIKPESARMLGKRLRVSPEYILYGKGVGPETVENLSRSRDISLFLTGDIEYFNKIQSGGTPISDKTTPVSGDAVLPRRLFSLLIPDGAMEQSAYPSYRAGMVVFVNPDANFEPGQVVQAIIPGMKCAVVRKVRIELLENGEQATILEPFNTSYPAIRLNPDRGDYIIGPVIGSLDLPS